MKEVSLLRDVTSKVLNRQPNLHFLLTRTSFDVLILFTKGGDKKMIKGLEAVLLNSENAKALADFYKEVVGLKIKSEYEMGEGQNVYEMEVGSGSALYINDHTEVKGKNKDPKRVILNLEVDDIENEVARLDKEGVNKIQDTYHVEGYGLITTFEDPDGNYFQFVQVKAN